MRGRGLLKATRWGAWRRAVLGAWKSPRPCPQGVRSTCPHHHSHHPSTTSIPQRHHPPTTLIPQPLPSLNGIIPQRHHPSTTVPPNPGTPSTTSSTIYRHFSTAPRHTHDVQHTDTFHNTPTHSTSSPSHSTVYTHTFNKLPITLAM